MHTSNVYQNNAQTKGELKRNIAKEIGRRDRRLAIRLLGWKQKSGSFSFIEFVIKSMHTMALPAT